MTVIAQNVEQVRRDAMEIGYDAYRASVFVANPYLPGDVMYDHWADGYFLGVEQAREEDGLVPANDN